MLKFLKKNNAYKSYQDKRNNIENWDLFSGRIGDGSSVLDIACDAGFYSLEAAKKNCFVLGVDILKESLKKAKKNAESMALTRYVTFMERHVDEPFIDSLPVFEYVLCLSVFHHFCRAYGEDTAKKMIVGLFNTCGHSLFLQIPSKIGKYTEDFSVDFKGDQSKIEEYIVGIFHDCPDVEISYLGAKEEKPPGEQYRFLFEISHKT
ncbi:class I SAM-dependent methyltransferase [Gammaproteobacteria bacterium]|nr:class I SAM-dependent methyltransferase [Gammaproteobacteria bacterium]